MTISFDQFKQVSLKVAEVVSAEEHPNADKLLVLQVRLGEEQRQLVAGIRGHYPPEDLVGKKIVVVDNLAPAVLRGVESQGMLLAAQDGEKIVLIVPDQDVSAGSPVL